MSDRGDAINGLLNLYFTPFFASVASQHPLQLIIIDKHNQNFPLLPIKLPMRMTSAPMCTPL